MTLLTAVEASLVGVKVADVNVVRPVAPELTKTAGVDLKTRVIVAVASQAPDTGEKPLQDRQVSLA
jgi:hypothetical protein